jgi:hypothetical protein
MDKQAKALIIMMGASLLIGVLILVFKPDYRIDNILDTNRDYFPLAKIEGRE